MSRLTWRELELRAKLFFEAELRVSLREHMPVPLSTGEEHKFDLVSQDEAIIVECKSYTWTKSGRFPSAKVSEAQRCADLLRKSQAERRIIVFQDDLGPQGSLVEVFVRRNRQLLAGMEVWRLLDDRFEKVADYSGERRSSGVLEIVFDPKVKPYLEEQDLSVLPGGVVRDRRYRVGIKNAGRESVQKSRLVLEDCEPSTEEGVHLGHALQVMGRLRGTDEFSVHSGKIPSVFVDVVYDQTVGGQLQGNAFGLCYAAPVASHAIRRGSYVLTLRIEGDGVATSRKMFKIGQDPSGMLTMCELNG